MQKIAKILSPASKFSSCNNLQSIYRPYSLAYKNFWGTAEQAGFPRKCPPSAKLIFQKLYWRADREGLSHCTAKLLAKAAKISPRQTWWALQYLRSQELITRIPGPDKHGSNYRIKNEIWVTLKTRDENLNTWISQKKGKEAKIQMALALLKKQKHEDKGIESMSENEWNAHLQCISDLTDFPHDSS